MRNYFRLLYDKEVQFYVLKRLGLLDRLDDEKYLKKQFYAITRKKLDLNNAITFNEKIQVLKLIDRKELYTSLVDKYEVRNFVEKNLGKKYLIPLIGVWDDPEQIDFDLLPEQFVLKCNHNSGVGMCICKNKNDIDIKTVRKELKKGLDENYYLSGREWPYKNVKRKIIAEKYMVDESGTELKDYKLFTFEGKVHYIQVDYDRFTDHHRNFYDLEWNYVPFTTLYPTNPNREIAKPICLERLIESAEVLAKAAGTPHFVRVDFYVINDQIYFGEMTFYHGSGYEKFYPEEYGEKLGDLIKLS